MRRIYYFDTKQVDDDIVSLALAGINGEWFYAEVVSAVASAPVQQKLRKVAGTHFVNADGLAACLRGWLFEQNAPAWPRLELQIRSNAINTPPDFVHRTLAQLLNCKADFTGRLEVSQRTADSHITDEFYQRTGGEDHVTPHALIEAIALAYGDAARTENMVSYDILPFELLMGAKNAASFRAWARGYVRPNSTSANVSDIARPTVQAAI